MDNDGTSCDETINFGANILVEMAEKKRQKAEAEARKTPFGKKITELEEAVDTIKRVLKIPSSTSVIDQKVFDEYYPKFVKEEKDALRENEQEGR
ncbi:hypothetical protein KAR91_86755 [Candidatus Pacearchaeota archaeon]|nr:hypothetical protein [Candidatus Pacearchaeota archaeon]